MLFRSETREKLEAIGLFVVAMPSEQFTAFLAAELPRWAKVARASGAKLD